MEAMTLAADCTASSSVAVFFEMASERSSISWRVSPAAPPVERSTASVRAPTFSASCHSPSAKAPTDATPMPTMASLIPELARWMPAPCLPAARSRSPSAFCACFASPVMSTSRRRDFAI